MIIWWLFALLWLFVTLKCERERLTRFRIRQAMLSQNTGGQACTSGKGYLWFAWFLTARCPPCTLMYAVKIVRTQGFELPFTIYAFEIQESFCLLALRLTYLTAHRQPQQMQRIRLSKLAPTRRVYCNLNSSKTQTRLTTADFAEYKRAIGRNNDYKSSHHKWTRWCHSCSEKIDERFGNQKSNRFNKTGMWFYNDLNMLHALRRSNLQQSIDLKQTGSISCHTLRVFVTVWLFWLFAGRLRNLAEETSSLRHHAEESFRDWLRRMLVRTAALKTFCIGSTYFFWIGST